jgi:hypothetical protein
LTRKQRKQLETRSNSVPDALILKMIQVADKNGGQVAGSGGNEHERGREPLVSVSACNRDARIVTRES